MFTNFRIKIRGFFRKYKYIIILSVIAFSIVVMINEFFKNYEEPVIPQVSYEPNKPIINEKEEVPEEEQEPIADIFETYVEYCNQKQYEKAYEMLSTECKKVVCPTLEEYVEYIELVFDQKKIYNIQNMSNIDGEYIYRVRFLDNILATGTTEEDDLWYDEEIITVVTENNEKKLNIREFIGTDYINEFYEDEYMKIEIESRNVQYEAEEYDVKITNRCEYTIVIADSTQVEEITIQAGGQTLSSGNEYKDIIILNPGESKSYTLTFGKYYDLSSATDSMNFNMVRILKSYTGTEETRQEELDNAEAIFSLEIEI